MWDEKTRLEKLKKIDLLTAPREVCDAITKVALPLFNVPTCLVTVIHKQTQHIFSKEGFVLDQTDRDAAFCSHTIMQNDVFEVTDALADLRFARNPLVINDPKIRYYCGVPIFFEELPIGSLCLIDYKERNSLTEQQRDLLRQLSKIIITHLQSQYVLKRTDEYIRALKYELPLNREKAP